MNHIYFVLKDILLKIKGIALIRITILSIAIVLCAAVGAYIFEGDMSLSDALWWSLVTVTTVGYGDITPASLGGKVFGGILMVLGIGFIGLFTGTLAATFVEGRSRRDRGLKPVDCEGHICICGWSHKAQEIIEELRADLKTKDKPVVLVANLPESPIKDDNFHFVHGDVTPEVLGKANVKEAQVAIVLGDETIESYSRDAKAILNVLTIKTVNPDLYVCIELADRENYDHCMRARADEIVVSGELSSALLVQGALDHGMTRIISELVSNRYGSELYKLKVPPSIVGMSFVEAMVRLKERHTVTLVAVESVDRTDLKINPPADNRIREGERIVVIGDERPERIE